MSQANCNTAFVQQIRKDGDFQDYLTYQTLEKIELLKKQLHEAVSLAGNTRSEVIDFMRQRLVQVRRYLAFVA